MNGNVAKSVANVTKTERTKDSINKKEHNSKPTLFPDWDYDCGHEKRGVERKTREITATTTTNDSPNSLYSRGWQ